MKAIFLIFSTIGCAGGPVDSGDLDDTSTSDTGLEDSGTDGPAPGWGAITGDCGDFDAEEISSPEAFWFRNAIDLPGEPPPAELTEGAQELLEDGTLGGSSIWSEVFAFEVLHRCEGAAYLKSEGEISYDDPDGKKTDVLVSLDGATLGVSVTRAFKYPPGTPFELADAEALLNKKLADVLLSSQNVSAADAWEKQALHVIAWDAQAADSLQAAWPTLDAAVRADAVLYVTVTDGADEFVY